MKYTIPTYKKDKLVKRLEKFNRKAVKFHALPIIYTVSNPYDKEFSKWQYDFIKDTDVEIKYFVNVVDVDIDTESFKPLKGYEFLASIEHTENGNIIINKIPGKEIPHRYRDSGHFCDHCKTNRFRKNTYIVFNEEKNDFVQVGSTCIKDYLGIDVALIAQRFEFLQELEGISKSDHDSKYIEPRFDLKVFLATCLNIMTFDGYVSGKKAWETQGFKNATGKTACNVIRGPLGKVDKDTRKWFEERANFTEEHLIETDEVITYVKTLPTDLDYYNNLNTIIKK